MAKDITDGLIVKCGSQCDNMTKAMEELDAKRHKARYRGENIYLLITDRSLDISMVPHDQQQETLVGLDIIAALVTQLLEASTPPEEIAIRLQAVSRRKGDLADIIGNILLGSEV